MSNSLQRRVALLNTLTSWIDRIVTLLVNFFLKPLIITFLGGATYGVWEMLNKMNGFMATADFRASTTVKWVVSRNRSSDSTNELNKSISSGFWANIMTLPLYIFIGSFLVYSSPYITQVSSESYALVRCVSFLLLLSFIITQMFFLFESVLHGMNLSYKRIGVRAFITILCALATYIMLYMGYGMIGMAVIQIITIIITGFTFWFIVKENLPWIRIVKVPLVEVFGFLKLSLWFMLDKFTSLLNESLDVLIIGFIIGSIYVTSYTVSSYVLIASLGFINLFIGAIITAISSFIKEGKIKQIIESRKLMYLLTMFSIGAISITYLCFNKSFISIWTDESYFLGTKTCILIVFWIILKSISLIDSSIMRMFLNIKQVITNSFISATLIIVLAFILVSRLGVDGMLYALIAGYLLQSILNAFNVAKTLKLKFDIFSIYINRLSITLVLLGSFAIYYNDFFYVDSWMNLILFSLIVFIIVTITIYLIGLNKNEKATIYSHFKKI